MDSAQGRSTETIKHACCQEKHLSRLVLEARGQPGFQNWRFLGEGRVASKYVKWIYCKTRSDFPWRKRRMSPPRLRRGGLMRRLRQGKSDRFLQ